MHSSIKKYWLFSSLVYFGVLLLDSFLGDPSMSFEFSFIDNIWVIPFGYLFLEGVNIICLYFFSYRGCGTTLLAWNMALCLVRASLGLVPFRMWQDYLALYADKTTTLLIIDLSLLFVYFAICVQWFYFSYQLRKENKSLRKNELLSQPD